jgi:hypothetical protein
MHGGMERSWLWPPLEHRAWRTGQTLDPPRHSERPFPVAGEALGMGEDTCFLERGRPHFSIHLKVCLKSWIEGHHTAQDH